MTRSISLIYVRVNKGWHLSFSQPQAGSPAGGVVPPPGHTIVRFNVIYSPTLWKIKTIEEFIKSLSQKQQTTLESR